MCIFIYTYNIYMNIYSLNKVNKNIHIFFNKEFIHSLNKMIYIYVCVLLGLQLTQIL